MPPSTATWVRCPRLTVTTEYSVTIERPTTERPGSTISSAVRVEVLRAARRRSPRRSPRPTARDPPAGTRSRGRRRGRRPGTGRARRSPPRRGRSRRGRAAASRCARAGPRSSSRGTAAIRSSSAGASSSATPNFDSGLPVSIAACVRPGTRRVDRGAARAWRATSRAARGGRRRRGRRSRSSRRRRRAPRRCPRRTSRCRAAGCRRVEAGRQRDRQLARRCDVAAEPLLGEHARHRRARERLGGEVHVRARDGGS